MVNIVFNILGNTVSFCIFKRWARTKGIKSSVGIDRHVLFVDIDNMNLQNLVEKIKQLDEVYRFGDVYIFKTHEDSMHWHVFCPSIFSTREIVEIIAQFNLEYIPYGLKNCGWVLRILPKDNRKVSTPLYTYFIPGISDRSRSIAHLEFLRAYYYCFENTEKRYGDINSKVIIEEYSTPSSGWLKNENNL